MALKAFFSPLFCLVVQCLCVDVATGAAADFFNDPEVVQDWIFQMINIFPVWEKGIFGKGIRVRVNDEGVDYLHEEFQGRFDVDASCEVFDAWFNEDSQEYLQHGTVVASVIGAAGNNSQCAVGIAPEVTLSSCRVITTEFVDKTAENGTFPAYKLDQFDISQNSFASTGCAPQDGFTLSGVFVNTNECPFTHKPAAPLVIDGVVLDEQHPCDACNFPSMEQPESCLSAVKLYCQVFFEVDQDTCTGLLDDLRTNGECTILPQNDATVAAMEQGAQEGRNGKGVIYVFASGNTFASAGNSNFEMQGRYIVFVGAVGKDGQHTKYSTPGASVLLTAPAGDYEDDNKQTVAKAGGQCQLAGAGTSFSSPIVSGVVALMLEVNPDLTWRDVQGILVTTSRPVTHTVFNDQTQATNGAGLVHSNLYGFGIVDAMAAVTAAESWILYGDEELVSAKALDLDLVIGDDPNTPTTSELTIGSTGSHILVENVEVDIYLEHLSRGHLQISLTSPNGTVSELTPGSIPENGQVNDPWKFRTVRSWGEVPVGTWTLSIVDKVDGDVSDCIDFSNFEGDFQGYPVGCDLLESLPIFQNEVFVDAAKLLLDFKIGEYCCICGGGNVIFDGVCEDIVDPLIGNVCFDVTEVCTDNELLPEIAILGTTDVRGLNMTEVCCAVGGGRNYSDPASFRDQLLGWELKVYGHKDPSKTRSPTMTPSGMPSKEPELPLILIISGASTVDVLGSLLVVVSLNLFAALFT